MKREIDIICFSGTGNTRRIVEIITGILNQNDITTNLISERSHYVHERGKEVLFAFPVNSQAVSPFIWKYMKELPDGTNDKIHVVVTLNESQAVLKPLNRILIKKNYVPQGAIEISMPNNLLTGPDTTYQRLSKAKEEAKRFANDIVLNQDSWKEERKGSAFVSFLSRDTVLPWMTMRMVNKLETDTTQCQKCGVCVQTCPVQNIHMEEFPVHKNQCQFCMCCGATCPSGAIHFKGKPQFQIRSIDESEKQAEDSR